MLIEIFPSFKKQSEDCCPKNEATDGETCCTIADTGTEELVLLKEKVRKQLPSWVSVHLYDYTLAMDRLIAQRKLKDLLVQKGFGFIATLENDDLLDKVTPSVVVNGNLVSFRSIPNEVELVRIAEETLEVQGRQ